MHQAMFSLLLKDIIWVIAGCLLSRPSVRSPMTAA